MTNYQGDYLENDEDEDDLPLFQQKKYLQMEIQISKELKEQSGDNMNKELQSQESNIKDQDKFINNTKNKDIFNQKQQETDGRIIMDKNIKIYEEDEYELSQHKYYQIKSKNPKADFNNPNNPNYKGRQSKLVSGLMKNQNILKRDNEKEFLLQKYENDIPSKSYKQQKQLYRNEVKDVSSVNQQIDDKYSYKIFYQSNNSHQVNENISDELIEEQQDLFGQKQRFRDQYVTDKSKYSGREERFYESNYRFKGSVYENDRNLDIKKTNYKNEIVKDLSDSEDYRYYQYKQSKIRDLGRQISVNDDYIKNKDDIYNYESKNIKQRGRIQDQNSDYYRLNYQRDISREEYLTGKDNDLDDSKDHIEYNHRDRSRFDKKYESKYSREEFSRKYQQNYQKQHKYSYEEEQDVLKDERQITDDQNDNNTDRQNQYDHDMVMLMKRAKGRAYQASEQYKIRRGDKLDRYGRGDRIYNNFIKTNIRGNNDFRFQRGRGSQHFTQQSEMFIFKPKEKESNDSQKFNYLKDQKNEQQFIHENISKKHEIEQSDYRNNYEEEENIEQFQKDIQNQIQKYELISEEQMKKQHGVENENIEEEEEEQKQRGIKLIYETFKDASSIFSNPLFFKTQEQKQVKPRFFEDYDDGSDQENNFTNQTDSDKNLNSVQQLGQSLFSQIGQSMWFNHKEQIEEQQEEDKVQEENPSIIQYNNYEEDYEYLKYKNYEQQNEVGLSSSSLASLRKRLLDPQRNDFTNQIIQHNNQIGQNKFMSLAALPVPKFIQEQQARQIQFQKIIDEEDSDS